MNLHFSTSKSTFDYMANLGQRTLENIVLTLNSLKQIVHNPVGIPLFLYRGMPKRVVSEQCLEEGSKGGGKRSERTNSAILAFRCKTLYFTNSIRFNQFEVVFS